MVQGLICEENKLTGTNQQETKGLKIVTFETRGLKHKKGLTGPRVLNLLKRGAKT
jgi:hypothetical protein